MDLVIVWGGLCEDSGIRIYKEVAMLKHWKRILRDIIIIWIFSLFGGFILGLGSGRGETPMEIRGIVNIIFTIISGTIIGYIIRDKIVDKFNYITLLGALTAITSIINVYLYDVNYMTIIYGSIVVIFSLWIGLAISSLIIRVMKSVKPKESMSQ